MKTFEEVHVDSNISKGNQVVINLPVGQTYETVGLSLTDIAKSDIENIRLNINGRMVSEWSDATVLETIDKYYSKHIDANVLLFNFLAMEFDDPQYQSAFGLGTDGLDTVDIQFKIKADAAGANPAIEAWAVKGVASKTGTLTKIRTFPVHVSAGRTDFTDITKVEGARIKAIHLIKENVDDISKVEFEVDKTLYVEASRSALETMQKAYGREPQAGVYTIDFGLQGKFYELLKIPTKYVPVNPEDENSPMTINKNRIKDWRLRINAATEGQVTVIVEYADVWSKGGF